MHIIRSALPRRTKRADNMQDRTHSEHGHVFAQGARDGIPIGLGYFPRINDYDKWAIKWGYTYF
ncbi:MAG: zinc-dependent metalloprotease, partial [Oscillospiraceae bacterium]|nr:zinc-dependent metalloprotease [Oscillospiraceae bacterium]